MVSFVRNSLLTASMFVCVVVVTLVFNLALTRFEAFKLGVPPPSAFSPYPWFFAQAIVLIPMGALAIWIFAGRHRQWWALLLAVLVGLLYAHFAPYSTVQIKNLAFSVSYFLVGSTGMLAGATLFVMVARWRAARQT